MSPTSLVGMIAVWRSAEISSGASIWYGVSAYSTWPARPRISFASSSTKASNAAASTVSSDDCTTTCSNNGSGPRTSSSRLRAICASGLLVNSTSLVKTPPML